jgi:hypothetical protein
MQNSVQPLEDLFIAQNSLTNQDTAHASCRSRKPNSGFSFFIYLFFLVICIPISEEQKYNNTIQYTAE